MKAAVGGAARSAEVILELGHAYEALLEEAPRIATGGELELKPVRVSARRRSGAYYTPRWLIEHVLDVALEPVLSGMDAAAIRRVRVLDPSCGCGHFLVAAAERLARRLTGSGGSARALRAAAACVFGVDSDPVAVEVCRAALAARCGRAAAGVVCGDGLAGPLPGGDGFDVVIGNPPFLNRLESHGAVDRGLAARLRERFGAAARAYTDLSALFLLRSVLAVRDGGRVALVQPQSVLSARDAVGVREEVSRRAAITDLWLADEHTFDASVFVCVTAFRVGGLQGRVRRRLGRALARLPDAAGGTSWGGLSAWDVPDVKVESGSTIADLAEVAADFRDEYYGLRGLVIEHRDVPAGARKRFPKLVTTGLIEPASNMWGESACRFDRQAWDAPRVDLSRLGSTTDLGRWASARLRPKLLLATQTRVLEVAPDAAGEALPVTPLISVAPRSRGDLWLLGAALASPVLSALAARVGAGSAMTHHAIKLSASQVRELPVPRRGKTWREGADLYRRASGAKEPTRLELLRQSARVMCRAYDVTAKQTAELMAWWWDRMAGGGPDRLLARRGGSRGPERTQRE